jgi:hypothetical protein
MCFSIGDAKPESCEVESILKVASENESRGKERSERQRGNEQSEGEERSRPVPAGIVERI